MVEGKTSSRAEVTSGVPQGSVLGPLLFLLFIKDLPNYLQEKSTVRLFADDAVLYRQINNDTDATLLQQDLDSLLQWENDWGMSFHPSKCQVMRITTKKAVRETSYNRAAQRAAPWPILCGPRALLDKSRSSMST